MPTQTYASEQVENLATAFPRRNEASFAWGGAISYYLGLQNTRAFWPISSVDENEDIYDVSGQGRVLTRTPSIAFSKYGLVPYFTLNGSTQYLYRTNEPGLDVTGSFCYMAWMRPSVITGNNRDVFSKHNGATGIAFRLTVHNSNLIAQIGTTGIAFTQTIASTVIPVVNQWQFVAIQYISSSELSVWKDATKSSLLAGIPASIFSSPAPLRVGSYNATAFYGGDLTLLHFGTGSLSDAQIRAIYYLTRPLFYGS